MKKLKLFSDYFVVSDGRETYNDIRRKYWQLSILAREKWINIYNNYSNLDNFVSKGMSDGNTVIFSVIEEAITELLSNEITHINDEIFVLEYFSDKYNWEDYYNEIADKYYEIVYTQEQMDVYRTARRQSRGRWQGRGLGISGALKGAATAGAFNMAEGALHGTFNTLGKVKDSIANSMKKSRIYNSDKNKELLSKGIFLNCMQVCEALVDAFLNNGFKRIDRVISKDISEAKALSTNLNNVAFPKNKEKDTTYKILTLNPYSNSIYETLIHKFRDQTSNIKDIADFFGVNMSYHIKELIEDKINNLLNQSKENSLQELIEIRNGVTEIISEMGFNENDEFTIDSLQGLDSLIFKQKLESVKRYKSSLDLSSEENACLAVTQIIDFCNKIDLSHENEIVLTILDEFQHKMMQFKEEGLRKYYGLLKIDTLEQADNGVFQNRIVLVDKCPFAYRA